MTNIEPLSLQKYLWPVLFMSVLLTMAIAPLWVTDIPPLLDYHNHLARQYILQRLESSETLSQFYTSAWPATPYLAFDGIVQALSGYMPVAWAGKVFLAAMFLLLALAPVALNLSLYGRITPLALAGLLFLHNETVSAGFVNYLFGLGFALCLFALWIKLRQASLSLRLILFPVLCALLFFSHLLGFMIYLLCVGSYELGRHFAGLRGGPWRTFLTLHVDQRWNLLSLVLQALPPLVIFTLYGPSTDTVTSNTYGGLERKFTFLHGLFEYLIPPYLWSLDRFLIIALPAALLLLIVLRVLSLPRALHWPLGAMLVFFFAMPMELFSGWGADHRLLPALGLLLIGALGPGPAWNRFYEHTIALVLLILVAVRATAVTFDWQRSNEYYAEYRRAFDHVPDGSRLFFAFGHSGGKSFKPYPVYHLPHLVLATKDVYVPFLFASPPGGGFTLQYQPSVEPLQDLSPGPVLLNGVSPAWERLLSAYDHFLLINPQHFDRPVPVDLRLVFAGDTVMLYRREPTTN